MSTASVVVIDGPDDIRPFMGMRVSVSRLSSKYEGRVHEFDKVGFTVRSQNEDGVLVELSFLYSLRVSVTLAQAEVKKAIRKEIEKEGKIPRKRLTFSFVVREDLTSERIGEYREIVLKALQEIRASGNLGHEEHVMIDRILYDHSDFDHVREHLVARRLLWKLANENEDPKSSPEIQEELDRVEAVLEKAGVT